MKEQAAHVRGSTKEDERSDKAGTLLATLQIQVKSRYGESTSADR